MTKHWIALALAGGLLSGCAAMAEMGSAIQKAGAEANARSARQQRMDDNAGGMELIAKDVYTAAMVVESIMKENGFSTSSAPYKRGPGQGIGVTGKKTTQKDLGNTVGMNVVGNMLGADRSRIITRTEETTTVWLWQKWNADFSGPEAGRLLFANAGDVHDVNQAGQQVNVRPYDTGQMVALRDGVQARLK